MQDTDDYQLINAINKEKKLATIRREILAMPAEKALDTILDSSFPATLVQSFPEQDLYFLMHHIGEEDFIPVLALASSNQWEYILDVEVWDNDRLDLAQMTNKLDLLFRADPERVLRWTIKEKTEFIEYYLFKNIEIVIREHDQDPSDFIDALGDNQNEFTTIDSVFYFRLKQATDSIDDAKNYGDDYDRDYDIKENDYDKNLSAEDLEEELEVESADKTNADSSESLITNMLNTLADMDISVFHGVLLETSTIIPAETEEEEYRLKNVRLAEKGFLPPHKAVAVYQPLKIKDLRERSPFFLTKSPIESEISYPPLYLSSMLQNETISRKKSKELEEIPLKNSKKLFADSLEYLNVYNNNMVIYLNLQSETSFLVNSVASADKMVIRSREELEKIVEKTCCFLSLGMEIIHSKFYKKPIDRQYMIRSGADILCKYALKDIFRIGSGAGIALKEKARRWYEQSHIARLGLPLTFLDEKWLGVIGGLLIDKPLFFDNYKTGVLYRPFSSLEDIENTSTELESIIEIDNMLKHFNPDSSEFSEFSFALFSDYVSDYVSDLISLKFLTWKSLFLTLWALKRMGIEKKSAGDNLSGIPFDRFKQFFIQMLNLKNETNKGEDNLYLKKNMDEGDERQYTNKKMNEYKANPHRIAQENEDRINMGELKLDLIGKIDHIIRNDFFNWLVESGIVRGIGNENNLVESGNVRRGVINENDRLESGNVRGAINGNDLVSATVRESFNQTFDEIEEEYGLVSPDDIDPKLIYHFITTIP